MTLKIGVDIGGTYVRAGLVDSNKVLKKSRLKLSKNPLDDILKVIDDVYDPRVKGIGIGAPAPLDTKKGIIIKPRNLKVKNLKIVDIVKRRFKKPTKLENDANCFALAESRFGKAKRYKDIMGVIIGTGLGSGIIIDNKIYSGNTDSAGEIGRISYKNKLLENYCNAAFLKNKFKKDPTELKNKRYYKEYAKNVAYALSILINTLDPEIILLWGGVSANYRFFKDILKKELKPMIYERAYNKIKIVQSTMKDVGLIGASCLI